VKRYVLDASALMAFFEREPGADQVEELLRAAAASERPLLLSVVNWGEVYYSIWRKYGEDAAARKDDEIARLPIEVVDADLPQARLAGSLKARHKLPYADAFAASLALSRNAPLVTSDPDFKPLGKQLELLWAH
jgi:predicted nucleic acid-binding protein